MKRFVLLGLILLLAAPAFAQGPAFQATSLPRQVRGEGVTETMGDVVLLVTNGGATTVLKSGSTINIVYGGTVTSTPATATSVVNNQNVPVAGNSLVACTTAAGGAPVGCNYFVTISGAQLTISFLADWTITGAFQGFSVNNVRVDVSAFSAGQTINAYLSGVSIAPATNPITFTQPSVTVGLVSKPSLSQVAAVTAPSAGPTFTTSPISLLTCQVNAVATGTTTRAKITEQFPAALTSGGGAGLDENLFTANITPTNGTIIQMVVHNVPTGVSIVMTPFLATSATAAVTGALPALGLATQKAQIAASASGKNVSSNANITALLGAMGNTATLTGSGADQTFFIIVSGDSTATIEDLVVDFAASNAAAITPPAASLSLTVDVSLVPTGTVTSSFSPVVRFAATPLGTFTIGAYGNCTSLLLYPYVAANVAGFDTGLAIANTTKDVLSATYTASAQAGACTLTGYPSTWTADSTGLVTAVTAGTAVTMTTPSIPAGGTWAQSMGSTTAFGATGFVGYVFASCQFLDAHGFAFIVNGFGGGTVNVSHGYLPLILNPTASRVVPAGEALNN